VRALLDALGIDCAWFSGVSGGAPYALACGALLGHRATGVVIVSGIGVVDRKTLAAMLPANRLAFRLSRRAPSLLRWQTSRAARKSGDQAPARRRRSVRPPRGVPASDLAIVGDPETRELLSVDVAESLRQGGDALVHELRALQMPFGLPLHQVIVPVHFLHGEADVHAPIGAAERLAATIPTATFTRLPGAGHLWLAGEPGRLLDLVTGA
jgi:pimeloyl-ACP methyl ester carboxylesterase